MNRRVTLRCKVKSGNDGAVAKASLKRAKEYFDVDPKPSDLPMARLKVW